MRYKLHDPKAHSKGGTLENTLNGRTEGEDNAPPPGGYIPPNRDPNKVRTPSEGEDNAPPP